MEFSKMIKNYLSLVKFSHTIFALPFAMIGFTLGVYSIDSFAYHLFIKVLLCMVFARNAAMAYNRYLDRDIDSINPRTKNREIPAGKISARRVLSFVFLNSFMFILTCYFINRLCFFLSPVALLIILGYSYTKRFTILCHLVLGLGLSLAPIGAFLAVTNHFDFLPVLFSSVVLTWVAGFDIIYSLQDDEFDRAQELYSIPATLGRSGALKLSSLLHIITAILLCVSIYFTYIRYEQIHWISIVGLLIFLSMLLYQHLIISVDDLSRVNIAFMTTNGIASVILGGLVISDFLI